MDLDLLVFNFKILILHLTAFYWIYNLAKMVAAFTTIVISLEWLHDPL